LDAERRRGREQERALLGRDAPVDDRRLDQQRHHASLNVGPERTQRRGRLARRARRHALVVAQTELVDDAAQELALLVRDDAVRADDCFDQPDDLRALLDVHASSVRYSRGMRALVLAVTLGMVSVAPVARAQQTSAQQRVDTAARVVNNLIARYAAGTATMDEVGTWLAR